MAGPPHLVAVGRARRRRLKGASSRAAVGASTLEPKRRVGHSNMLAALIYQHATGDAIARLPPGIDARLERREIWPANGPPGPA